MAKRKGKNENGERQEYLDERKNLISSENDVAKSFDKIIMTLAAGALGLSITFLNEIVDKPLKETLWQLKTAWCLFGGTLFLILLAHLLAKKAFSKQIEILDEFYYPGDNGPDEPRTNYYSWTVNTLNWVCLFTFLTGVFFLALFSISNLKFA